MGQGSGLVLCGALGQTTMDALGGRRDSGVGIVAHGGDFREGGPELVPADDLEGHFAHPPGFVLESRHDARERPVVPGPQQPSDCPDSQPVVRARLRAREDPRCRGSAEGVDQLGVGALPSQECHAACDNLVLAPTLTLSVDAVSRGLAPLRHRHKFMLGGLTDAAAAAHPSVLTE